MDRVPTWVLWLLAVIALVSGAAAAISGQYVGALVFGGVGLTLLFDGCGRLQRERGSSRRSGGDSWRLRRWRVRGYLVFGFMVVSACAVLAVEVARHGFQPFDVFIVVVIAGLARAIWRIQQGLIVPRANHD
jgi:hypothetical protein